MTQAQQQQPRYVLNILGQDRPGIVAAVSRALTDAGCNIEDSSMTMLRGVFAMILLITVPQGSENSLRTALVGVTAMEGLTVHLDPYPEDDEGLGRTTEGEAYSLSVHGADHPGIVSAVTGLLAKEGLNVVDLSTRVIQGQVPVYVMTIDLVTPASVDAHDLNTRLQRLASEIDCAISFRRVETLTF